MNRRTPIPYKCPNARVIRGSLHTGINGFGRWAVSDRRRVPSPAPRTKAVRGGCSMLLAANHLLLTRFRPALAAQVLRYLF
jgi:hypothetical protein